MRLFCAACLAILTLHFLTLPCAAVTGSTREEPAISTTIRMMGIGGTALDLSSPGFKDAQGIALSNNAVTEPIRYEGPVVMPLSTPEGAQYKVPLPSSKLVLVIAVKTATNELRFLAIPDTYDEPETANISVLNLTNLDLLVRIGEIVHPVKSGSFQGRLWAQPAQKRLPVSIVGKSGDAIVPLINNRVKLLPGRGLILVLTGNKIASPLDIEHNDAQLSVVYPRLLFGP